MTPIVAPCCIIPIKAGKFPTLSDTPPEVFISAARYNKLHYNIMHEDGTFDAKINYFLFLLEKNSNGIYDNAFENTLFLVKNIEIDPSINVFYFTPPI